jgi:FkbH-like protein
MKPLDPATMRLLTDVAGSPLGAVRHVLVAAGAHFDMETAETLAGALGRQTGGEAAETIAAFATPLAGFLGVKALIDAGQSDAALNALQQVIGALPVPSADLLVMRAKLLAAGQTTIDAAMADLRTALDARPDHRFHARHDKFMATLLDHDWAPRRRARVALLGPGTLSFLAKAVRVIGFREWLDLDIYTPDFGAWCQDVLDPASDLYAFKPDVVVLIPNASDLGLGPRIGADTAEALADDLLGMRRLIAERLTAHVIQFGVDTPQPASWGGLEDQLTEGRRRTLGRLNDWLGDDLPEAVSYVAAERVLAFAPRIADQEQWHRAKLYPCQEATPGFAELIVAQVRAVLGLAMKALVVDLDNTLWGGIIGEDGLGGIVLGAPNPNGEAHAALQRYIKELGAKGVLLAVCSKNNLEDAEAPFREHDAMVLTRDDFVAFFANWQDKASNITAIASELNIGIDAIAFLDDNPAERAWIRSQLPDVRVIENDGTPVGMLGALDRSLLFESVGLTSEDTTRQVSYRANAALRGNAIDERSMDDFLVGLAMRCDHGPVDSLRLKRVAQLVNKTNQFNLTTRRYGEAEIKRAGESGDWWWHWFSLSDRFGDHGLIGVMAARKQGTRWHLDNWLMSCRVLGRKVEDFMMATLVQAASAAGANEITAEYIPSKKNAMVEALLPGVGFEPAGSDGDAILYRLAVDAAAAGAATHIADCTGEAA